MIVGDIVTNNARLYPDRAGIVDKDVRLTWRQVDRRTNSLSNALANLGLQKGDRVAIICENNHYYAEFLLSIAKNGLIGTGISYRFTPQQMAAVINDCRPRAILCQGKFAATLNEAKPRIESVDYFIGMGKEHGFPLDYDAMLAESPGDAVEADVNESDTFLIVYTTGTTGAPKGVISTHRVWFSIILTRLLAYRLAAEDVYLVHGPLYLAGGLQHFVTACLGGCTVVVESFSAGRFTGLIEKEKVTVSHLLPVHYKLLRDHLETTGHKNDLSSLKKLAFGAGQGVMAEQVREILGFFGISWSNKLYGMTEGIVSFMMSEDIAAGLSSTANESQRRRLDSVGKPVFGARVRIVGEDDKDVPCGEVGEVLVKSDYWMEGYWNNPDLTRQVMRDGWYHTSDMGMFDEDGYLYLVGRKDALIKSGGLFVAPQEVEDAILQHPVVAEVAVIGVLDQAWGQIVKAVVCLKEGQQATEEEIKEHCRHKLASYQVPKIVEFTEKLPKDPVYGKVSLKELIKIYGKGRA